MRATKCHDNHIKTKNGQCKGRKNEKRPGEKHKNSILLQIFPFYSVALFKTFNCQERDRSLGSKKHQWNEKLLKVILNLPNLPFLLCNVLRALNGQNWAINKIWELYRGFPSQLWSLTKRLTSGLKMIGLMEAIQSATYCPIVDNRFIWLKVHAAMW